MVCACAANDTMPFELLVKHPKIHTFINYRPEDGRSALSYAACNGNRAMVNILLRTGADVDSCDMVASFYLTLFSGDEHRFFTPR